VIEKRTSYTLEEHLVDEFCLALLSSPNPWGQLRLTKEFFYVRGRTDVVAIDENASVIAFEMKLRKWQIALHQAFRNKCFANLSYVVLPEDTAIRAQRHAEEFAKRSVGLCYVKQGKVVVTLPTVPEQSIQPWLTMKAISRATGQTAND